MIASRRTLTGTLSILSIFAMVPTVGAVEQPTADSSVPSVAGLKEIVVTAQKRAERALDVPQSLSVLSADALQQRHATRMEDLISAVPNLGLQTANGQNAPIFSIRGISMYDYSFNQGSPVAVYIDEVVKNNNAVYGISFYDLERVEVLKGPQGTLYGKNTTGGAINFITNKPTFDGVNGYATVDYGNYDAVTATGAINLPVNDWAAFRVAAFYEYAHGYMENVVPGKQDLNGTGDYSVRTSLLLKPTDNLEIFLRGQTSTMQTSEYGVHPLVVPSLGVGAGTYTYFHNLDPVANPYLEDYEIGLGKYQVESNLGGSRFNESDSTAMTVTWHATNDLTVTSISSWDYGNFYSPEDTSGSVREMFYNIYVDNDKQITQDLRLTSAFDGPFDFILGAYYNDEAVYNSTIVDYFLDIDPNVGPFTGAKAFPQGCDQAGVPPAFVPVNCTYVNSFEQHKRSYALYSDNTYRLGPAWKLHAGVRYTYDKGLVYRYRSDVWGGGEGLAYHGYYPGMPAPIANLIPGPPFSPSPGYSSEFSGGSPSGRVGVDFTPAKDQLIYASYSHGYRGKAFDAQAFFSPLSVNIAKEETNDAFEVGYKAELFDHRLQTSSDLFYESYKNLQYIDVNPIDGVGQLLNLPKERSYGAELELVGRPVGWATLSLSLGLLRATIVQGYAGGGTVNVAGKDLASAPHVSLNAGGEFVLARRDWGDFTLRVDDTSYSSQYFENENEPILRQPPYSLVNARLGVESASDRWHFALWARNVGNTYYITSRADNSGLGVYYQQVGAPRTYGVEAGLRF